MKNNMNHEHYMYRCIEIAKKGQGTTYPNPCVGCIIVYKDKIISEAHSSKYGGDHAEELREAVQVRGLVAALLCSCIHHCRCRPWGCLLEVGLKCT